MAAGASMLKLVSATKAAEPFDAIAAEAFGDEPSRGRLEAL
jgi:hypothetical protein